MTIYWLLLAFPAFLALLFPQVKGRHGVELGQAAALAAFGAFYVFLALLRYEVGADWYAYDAMYQTARFTNFEGALAITDPLFSLLLWLSAQFGLGLYFVNGLCALLLVSGLIAVAVQLRQPWLAIVSAVPYLLIVVGLGYIRQAGAIGLILLALAAIGNNRTGRSIALLVLAAGFHSTAAGVIPFFGLAIANRNKVRVFLIAAVGSVGLVAFLSRQLEVFETTYIATDYQSGGALVRIALSVLASAAVLLRWRHLDSPPRARSIWIGFAVANLLAMAALAVLDFSTAIDRVSLYFSVVQILFFANFAVMLGLSQRLDLLVRLLVIAVAVLVQLVWLVYATHADSWVPYQSVISYG